MIPAYLPLYDNVYDHCMTLEPTGKYNTFCECGFVQEIIFFTDHSLEYIEYSEDTDWLYPPKVNTKMSLSGKNRIKPFP